VALFCLNCSSYSKKLSFCSQCGIPGWRIRHVNPVEHHPYLDLMPKLVTYQQNPLIPFPIHPSDHDYGNVAQRITTILKQFSPIDESVKLSPRKEGLSIVTPRSKYRIIVAKKTPRWTHDPIKGYFTYVITTHYLDPRNEEAMHAVFRLLFMGDEYLLPFLRRGPKELTRPQKKVFEAFKHSYDSGDEGGAVILPTGIGKTVLAAKIIDYVKPRRLLFLAHRTLILDQAIDSVREENPRYKKKNIGRVFGATKDKDSKLKRNAVFGTPNSVFARLNQIQPDQFDLVIIDEFHHGPSMRYRTIIDHLKPKYTLGLTATPYRRDDNDPLAMVRNNVLYVEDSWESEQRLNDGDGFLPTFRLSSALALGYLVTPTIYIEKESPYHDSDGEVVPVNKLHKFAIPARAKKIAEKFEEHIGDRQTVIFCASVNEAGFLSQQFNDVLGIPSAYLLSRYPGTEKSIPVSERKKIIKDYRNKKIRVLFTVDIFNEGADVPTIEAAVWLQQSSTMVKILQQLGRGLRLAPGKRELIVLDFVNNISEVKAFLKFGRTSTGRLEPTVAAPPGRKVENKDLIDLLIDENQIRIQEEILYLLEREEWDESDEYGPFFEMLCDYGYTDREIVDIINTTQQHIMQQEPDMTFRPIGTQRVSSWTKNKKFLTRPSSPHFRAYFFRDLLKEIGVKNNIVGSVNQNADDKLRQQRCVTVFSRYMPFGDTYTDVLIEKHRHIVASWNNLGRYRYAFAKYLEHRIKLLEDKAMDDGEDFTINLASIVQETLTDSKKLLQYIKVPSISRLFDSDPVARILGAGHQFLKQLPAFEARRLYAQRLELVEIADKMSVSYEDVKRWYNNEWEYDKEDQLEKLVRNVLKKQYGLRRGETPTIRSTTISTLSTMFDEDNRDMKELVDKIVQKHHLAEEKRRDAARQAKQPVKPSIPSPERQRAIKRATRQCKSCQNSYIGRTKKCKSCQTPLCPNCAKDFCGVCYTSQSS